jgi:large subunit ribosomal protein L22
MEARAIVRNVRMTPRKIKLICDLIRGKDAGEAMAIIMNTPKAADGKAPQERGRKR